jgi:hypothetical protein
MLGAPKLAEKHETPCSRYVLQGVRQSTIECNWQRCLSYAYLDQSPDSSEGCAVPFHYKKEDAPATVTNRRDSNPFQQVTMDEYNLRCAGVSVIICPSQPPLTQVIQQPPDHPEL